MSITFLAFDLGASSGRAILGTFDGPNLVLREVHRFSNGPAEINGSLYWKFEELCAEIRKGISLAASECNGKISGISVDTWGVDYVFLGDDGEFMRTPYCYRDSRIKGADRRVFEKVSPVELYSRTGLQFLPFNTIFQLEAHRDTHPEDFENGKILMIPDAIIYMLCGTIGCEYTDASTSGLLNANARDWDRELISRLDLPERIFPAIDRSCSFAGPMRPEIQKECGVGPIPVYRVGGHDTASAIASVPADMSKKWAYISCGTWSIIGAELDKPILSENARKANYTNEGGLENTIRFLTNISGLWLLQECKRIWAENGEDLSYPEMVEMAKSAEPLRNIVNPNNEIFISPGNMPETIREYCRAHTDSVPEDKPSLIRCIFDSLAMAYGAKFAELKNILDTDFERIHILGGGCHNELLMQLAADALRVPVFAGPAEATAIGNMLGQAMAAGYFKSLSEGRKAVRKSFPLKEYSANSENSANMQAASAKFAELP